MPGEEVGFRLVTVMFSKKIIVTGKAFPKSQFTKVLAGGKMVMASVDLF